MTQEEIENMKRSISSKLIELVSNNLSTMKSSGPGGLTNKFYQTSKEETPILHKFIGKIEEVETLNSFYEASSTLIPKPDKDITRKVQSQIIH